MTRSGIWRVGVLVCMAVAASIVQADDVKETVHLVITGGPNAGTWEASSDRGGCSFGLAAPGAWGNQLSSAKDKDPRHFNSLQLIVPNAARASSGAHEFFLSVGFGPLMNRSAQYEVETRPDEKKKGGSGVITIVDHGTTGKVMFNVTTAAGIRMEGTIDCKSVVRSGK